jgi:hypothetical protein
LHPHGVDGDSRIHRHGIFNIAHLPHGPHAEGIQASELDISFESSYDDFENASSRNQSIQRKCSNLLKTSARPSTEHDSCSNGPLYIWYLHHKSSSFNWVILRHAELVDPATSSTRVLAAYPSKSPHYISDRPFSTKV